MKIKRLKIKFVVTLPALDLLSEIQNTLYRGGVAVLPNFDDITIELTKTQQQKTELILKRSYPNTWWKYINF